jgi:hypothetical protein
MDKIFDSGVFVNVAESYFQGDLHGPVLRIARDVSGLAFNLDAGTV